MRIFILIFIFSAHLSSFSQTIPNGDFENWEIRDHYKLDWWHTPLRNVKRTNQAIDGRYGLMLINTIEDEIGWNGYAQTINHKNLEEFNGFPYTEGPLSLVFWNKHNLSLGDTAEISAIFKENGKQIGKVKFQFFGDSEEEYVKYSVPIEWSGPRTPDSVWLYMTSCTDSTIDGNGYIIFDDLHFEFIGERMGEIPNASFENWTNVGIEFPTTWRSVDLYLYDTHGVFFDGQSIFQVTGPQAFNGESSIMVKSYNHFGEYRSGFAYVGTSDEHLSFQSFPVDEAYNYVEGYYKYLTSDSDSARLLYQTWDNGYHSSYDNHYFTPTSQWTYFKKPIRYAQESGIPNMASLSIWSSNHFPTANLDAELYLDDLKLVNEPSVSVREHISTNAISVYPNPCVDYISIQGSENVDRVLLVNILGEEQKVNLQGKLLNTSTLASGLYVLYLYRGDILIATSKIIKR